MDSKAKELLCRDPNHPRHYSIPHEAWSLWRQGTKLIRNISNTLYEIVHALAAESYWCRKGQFLPEIFHSVDWKATQNTSEQVSLSKRLFSIKHSTGMCRVDKFMHRWHQRSNPDCPRCGKVKDAQHVWVCKGLDSRSVWENSLEKLCLWMISVSTDPDIQHLLLHYLRSWWDDVEPSTYVPLALQEPIHDQHLLAGTVV
jgi:hypothetical protein